MSSKSDNPDQLIPEELMWLAFQFVLNELPAEQQSAFESRLEHDELACLAVSRATQLSLAMQVTCEQFHAGDIGDHRNADECKADEHKAAQRRAGGQSTDQSLQEREVLAERLRAQVAADRAKAEIRQQRVRKFSTVLACGIVCAAVVASVQQSGWLDRSFSRLASSSAVTENTVRPNESLPRTGVSSPATLGAPEETAGLLEMYAEGNLESELNVVSDPIAGLESTASSDVVWTASAELDVPDWLFTAIELQDDQQNERGERQSPESSVDSPEDENSESEVL